MISFIVPCYNEEQYIRDCIKSIKKAASNIDYEIIVVDNNCTDNTSEIARDEDVIVVTEDRKGVVFARQTGYENAKYDLIANIDADSRIPENWVDVALKNIQPEDVAAVTGPLVYDDASIWLRIATRFYYYVAYISNFFIGVVLQGGNCLIKKKYLDELDGYDTTIAFYGEDTMTAKRLYKYGKIKLLMNLNLYSSSRRLQKQGVFKTTWLYLINYFYVTFKNKSYSNDYKDFR